MDSEEKKAEAQPPENGASTPQAEQTLPQDALEKTNEELADETIDGTEQTGEKKPEDEKPAKQPSAFKKFFKKVDIYLLGVVLLIVIGLGFTMVSYLNSKKAPKPVNISAEKLTPGALKALSGSNVTINNSAQTLTIQGNAIFSGQVLMKGNLDVAGNIESGGSLTVPSLTTTGSTNLAGTQISTLQVAQTLTVQGQSSLDTLNVSGASTFSQPITASQITVTSLILSGNAVVTVPNHLEFTGASPTRTINNSVLGAGGTTSINGSDTSGTIDVNTGNNPPSNGGCFTAITFNRPFTNMPHIIISPIDEGAAEFEYYVTKSLTGFSVCAANGMPANQVFEFDYFITD